jgi:hypothetical protein
LGILAFQQDLDIVSFENWDARGLAGFLRRKQLGLKAREWAMKRFSMDNLVSSWDKAIQEAQRLDALGILSDAVYQAQQVESAVLKLHTSWRRLGGLQERLWVESGSSTPHLRDVLNALQTLSGPTMRVSLGELSGGKRVRLQLVEEAPEQLEPPSLP